MPTVTQTNWELQKGLAAHWEVQNKKTAMPIQDASAQSRRDNPAIRAAYAIWSKAQITKAGNLVGQACCLCGNVTFCWCEGCEEGHVKRLQVSAICNTCDQEGRVCRLCDDDHVDYPVRHKTSGAYFDGRFIQFPSGRQNPGCEQQ